MYIKPSARISVATQIGLIDEMKSKEKALKLKQLQQENYDERK